MTVECFAQRLLNPFRGAMHTVRHKAAEAATLDGVHWDIYVANDQLLQDLEVSRWTQVSDIRYGKWSLEEGLKRGPIYPSDDFLRMEAMGAVVYEHLTRTHDRVPFPFRDAYELWLLDREGRPLALLHSVIEESDVDLELPLTWLPGVAAREQFRTAALEELAGEGRMTITAADYLAAYVNGRAGPEPSGQWFLRDQAGGGLGVAGMGAWERLGGRILPAEAFPPLPLAEVGHDELHSRLIADFHGWQAPWLLVLPGLTVEMRRRLERQAQAQAFRVLDQHRLYPEVVERAVINATLVEAMMCRGQPEVSGAGEDAMSTFYIELNPGPTD